VAQSDKSDATSLGGTMAQNLQKLFAIRGYGDLGLRISGPITQVYLDAKQNVTKCEKNLKIGKFVLKKVYEFDYVHELSDKYMNKAKIEQIYNGQFTFKDNNDETKNKDKNKKRYLTLDESVSQLSNFLELMVQRPLSPIDRAIVEGCLEPYLEGEFVKNPIAKCDAIGDVTYAGMFAYKGEYVKLIKNVLLETHKNLWFGSRAYSGYIDTQRLRRDIAESNHPKELKNSFSKLLEIYMPTQDEQENSSKQDNENNEGKKKCNKKMHNFFNTSDKNDDTEK